MDVILVILAIFYCFCDAMIAIYIKTGGSQIPYVPACLAYVAENVE